MKNLQILTKSFYMTSLGLHYDYTLSPFIHEVSEGSKPVPTEPNSALFRLSKSKLKLLMLTENNVLWKGKVEPYVLQYGNDHSRVAFQVGIRYFDCLEDITKQYQAGSLVLNNRFTINRNTEKVENLACFRSDDINLHDEPVGTYYIRPCTLDKGPDSPERIYTLVCKLEENKIAKTRVKVDSVEVIGPNQEKYSLTRYVACYLESNRLREQTYSYYTLDQCVQSIHAEAKIPLGK